MDLRRIRDFGLVRRILTLPDVYSALGDDGVPSVNDFQVNQHPDIYYVLVSGESDVVGLFTLIPENMVSWAVHVVMLPWATTREKWAAARELAPWLASNTGCRRLTAAIPDSNRRAITYGTHGIGMHYVGTQEKAFMKDGMLRDLIILGRSVQGVEPCPVPSPE